MKRAFPLTLVLVAVLVLAGWRNGSPDRAAWEYREVGLSSTSPSEPKLNQLGAEGWELINVVAACYSTTCSYWAYLKRPK
jgi:hypothetical protein